MLVLKDIQTALKATIKAPGAGLKRGETVP